MHRAGYVYGCVAIRGVVIHRVAVPAPGRRVVSWSAPPVLAGHSGGRVGRRVEGRGRWRGASCRGAASSWWGRLLGGSSILVECPTKVGRGGRAAGRRPVRHRRRTPPWPCTRGRP